VLRSTLNSVVAASNQNATIFRDCLSALEAGQAVMQIILTEFALGKPIDLIEVAGQKVIDFQKYLTALNEKLLQAQVASDNVKLLAEGLDGPTVFGGG
jgi:hypothetical protein